MPKPEAIDLNLKNFATAKQAEYIDAVHAHGAIRAAAKALGVDRKTIHKAIDSARTKAAIQGYSPGHDWTRAVPDTHNAKGVSTYYNKDGKVTGQWVKASLDDKRAAEAQRAAFAALSEELPRVAPTPAPAITLDNLCTVYTLTDSHVGSLCWGEEGGADWDLKIAEKTLTGCFDLMVRAAPASRVGFVAQLGDFLHADGISPVTPTSGHVLDADGRFAKVVKVAVRVLRRVVSAALEKHQEVVVLLAEGNHDIASSIWLRTMFAALYENEPRVRVIDQPLPYYVYEHGSTMLAWHHGHLKRNDELPLLFAAQFPKVWGNTTKRYAHCGHRHHVEEKEHSGMTVVQHPTLTARDAYAARGGWIAERQATAITYSNKHGQVMRNTVVPEMVAE